MIIQNSKWWLSNTPATAWKNITQSVADFVESKIIKTFQVACFGTTTEAGLNIFWDDAVVKPLIADDLKRYFLMHYDEFLADVGRVNLVNLIQNYFDLKDVSAIDIRDHPVLKDYYPFFVVRICIPSVPAEVEQQIRDFLAVVLPARCKKHYQLIQS